MNTEDKAWVRSLYRKAFPADERMPFSVLLHENGRRNEIRVYLEEGLPVGFTVIFPYKDLVYLSYLAVEEDQRVQGYGGRILELTGERCRGKRIVVDIEECRDDAENAGERRKRKAFYQRHGYEPSGIFYRFYGVDYELLCSGGSLTKEEWQELTVHIWGVSARTARYRV